MANETMVLLEKIVVPLAGASSVTFTSIPQSYTDLQITMSSRVDAANGVAQLYFNGSTASDKRWRRLYGDGSSAASDSNTAQAYFRPIGINRSDQTASVFGNMSIYIPNYTSSSTYKSMSADGVNENNATFAEAALNAGLWESNSAITSITIIPSAGNFVQYSTFYLYGVAKQGVTPTNAPAATGGDKILFDGTYWYHTFTSTGTFTPKKNLTGDVLVVAGGGSGHVGTISTFYGAGGGAGEVKSSASQSLTNGTNYSVTVGAGGAAIASNTLQVSGNPGTSSAFGSIISSTTGGGGGIYTTGVGGTSGNGYTGGNPNADACGGGGGAGANGSAAPNSTTGGAGGTGVSTITGIGDFSGWLTATSSGVSGKIAGGGGGSAANNTANGGAGGAGGGGTTVGGGTNLNGVLNTGSGGSGGLYLANNSGQGGSGIVIVRYAA